MLSAIMGSPKAKKPSTADTSANDLKPQTMSPDKTEQQATAPTQILGKENVEQPIIIAEIGNILSKFILLCQQL